MPIPRGTQQLVELKEVARRLGTPYETVRYWWKQGRLLGRHTQDRRKRVMVPIEVVEFFLRFHRLPTKLELFEVEALSRTYLLELSGPDGGLTELAEPSSATSGSFSTSAAT